MKVGGLLIGNRAVLLRNLKLKKIIELKKWKNSSIKNVCMSGCRIASKQQSAWAFPFTAQRLKLSVFIRRPSSLRLHSKNFLKNIDFSL